MDCVNWAPRGGAGRGLVQKEKNICVGYYRDGLEVHCQLLSEVEEL